jgi:hypothetical protein
MHPISVFLFLAFFSCNQNTDKAGGDSAFAYDLSSPEAVYFMPKSLKEISGIQYKDENLIACIEDNNGIIYLYDTKKQEIVQEIIFGDKGDYEDLAIVKEDYYILRSDGVIFKKSMGGEYINYPTFLNQYNNTEGMCFDTKSNSLLIACKDEGGNGLNKHQKSIYSFSLLNHKLNQKPVLIVNTKNLFHKKKHTHLTADLENFSPSGIAINPLTDHLFLISAKGNTLIEFNEDGNILFIEKLPVHQFSQPEGICFSPQGDLYISNEGKEGQGTILRFKAR